MKKIPQSPNAHHNLSWHALKLARRFNAGSQWSFVFPSPEAGRQKSGVSPKGNTDLQSVWPAEFYSAESRAADRMSAGRTGHSPVFHLGKTPNLRALAALLLTLIAVWSSMFCTLSFAQTVDSVSQREVQRRQAALPRGEEALARGKAAMQAKNFALAHQEFRTAVRYLPDAIVSGKAHDDAVDGFCKSGVKLAEQRIAEGNYAEAEVIVSEILDPRYDPNCRPAAELLAHLQQPGYFNKTMGPKFIAKGEEAYNETRARNMWQVEKGWEEPVRQYGQAVNPYADAFARDAGGTARITTKLNTIIIPRVEFRDASIREAIDFLRQQAVANDPATQGKKGVDIVLRLTPLGQVAPPSVPVEPAAGPAAPAAPPAGAAPQGTAAPGTTPVSARPIVNRAVVAAPAISSAEARITITLNQIPLGEALRYIANQAGLKVKVEPYAVAIIPMSEQSNDLITKEYRVPPDFISTSVTAGYSALQAGAYKTKTGVAAPTGTGKDTQETTGGQQLVTREGAKDFLEAQGVPFPPGASANFLPQSSRLIVRNTQDNLDLVDALVEQATVAGPKQVEIESKFIEITQNNLKELGFDWLLGPFKVGSKGAFGSGGTSGNGTTVDPANFPFVNNSAVPVGATQPGQPFGQNPVTAGNRSGNLAISANAIDALLFPSLGTSAVAPGIFGLAGVFTDPQFQVVIRALNQKKGVDLLSAPKVTTKSGQRAVIEIVREFRYPVTFTAPQVPAVSSSVVGGTNPPVVVTPTTPATFETRNTGVTLEVEPVVGPDGVTIDLSMVPQVVEFEGFINYGSPINAIGINTTLGAIQTSVPVTLTENVINQPIFSTRKVTTSVSVWDGQTVVLGGLMREDVQKTEDKVPIIGDIPFIGRAFRTNVDQHIKRNLIIFVTARLITPGGQPANLGEEEEEGLLQPPLLPEVPAYKK